jgi:hypothetical protein
MRVLETFPDRNDCQMYIDGADTSKGAGESENSPAPSFPTNLALEKQTSSELNVTRLIKVARPIGDAESGNTVWVERVIQVHSR